MKKRQIILLGFLVLTTLAATVWYFGRRGKPDYSKDNETPPPQYDIYPEVWSQNSPLGESYEFKVNCGSDYEELEACFLWDLEKVQITAPDGTAYELNKDFNIQEYSGEITRRWVLYGPQDAGFLPPSGTYLFQYIKEGEVIYTQEVEYESTKVSYPTEVKMERRGKDLYVSWTPPSGVDSSMWYKAIIWNEAGTPDVLVSRVLEWDARDGLLSDVPFVEEGTYSLNVAVYFKDGYAYSEYLIFEW